MLKERRYIPRYPGPILWYEYIDGIAYHYDGAWNVQDSGVYLSLTSVWGTSGNNVLAAGDYGLMTYYDGAKWTPIPSGTWKYIDCIWATSPTKFYVGGEEGTVLRSRP